MTRRVTRRDFILMVTTGTAGAFLAACSPSGSSNAVPTLVGSGGDGSSNQGNDRTQPGDFSNPDPTFGQPTYSKQIIVTPTADFYTQTFSVPAEVNEAAWLLTIDGLVDHPLTLTLDDILAMEQVSEMRTLECIGNPVGGNLIGNATWTGVRLKPLLDQAGIQAGVLRAKFYAADEYTTAVDLDWILQEDTLLVHAMNDQPLTVGHGAPLRIMMPGLYGQKMPKWLTRIEFIGEAYQGYWEQLGWSDVADVRTNSAISSPPNLSLVNGAIVIQGWAYAGDRRITNVEVEIDGESDWMPCQLLEGESSRVWTQFWVSWTPTRTGAFSVAVRATDEQGFLQHEETDRLIDAAYPDGSAYIYSVAYTIEKADQ